MLKVENLEEKKLKLKGKGTTRFNQFGICLAQKFTTERALSFLASEYMKHLIFNLAG